MLDDGFNTDLVDSMIKRIHISNGAHEHIVVGVNTTNRLRDFAPWTDFHAAHATFTKRAMELCKSPNFKSMKLRETQYEHGYTPSAIKNIISQVYGYVICHPMILLDYKANEKIKEYESKVKASSSFILNNINSLS